MKLTIEPTARMLSIEGHPVRVWSGTDENGTPVEVFVRAVQPQTHDVERLAAFERELKELPPLRASAVDFRFIAD